MIASLTEEGVAEATPDVPADEWASPDYVKRQIDLIQDELTTRLGLKDGRTHRMSITILRETRMPAVQVEPCFVTNPREERLLREEAFRRDLAIAIAHGIERFFGPRGPDEAADGTETSQPLNQRS